ncbi:MAG: hypothetical protein PVJ21_20995 [Anaerolineales bacterium]|jgi:hypothetical protein
MKRTLTVASGFLLITLTLVGWLDARQTQPVELTPTLTGQPEYCLTCHRDLPEISPSHPVETFGCVICHGGERLALDADLAHSTMRGGANPSDLSVVETSCGGSNCHSGSEADQRDHIQRVMTSIQSTYAGAIASIRFTFGAQTDLTPIYGIDEVVDEHTETDISFLDTFDLSSETNPSIQKFGENCLTCHLRATPPEGDSYARQTGCAACHSPAPIDRSQGEVHTLTTAIPYTQCNTCHNRGNYDLRTMTFAERTDHSTLRIDDYYQPIGEFTQCEYTLDCVDCHTRIEAMGDGDIHADQKSIEYVRCKTCHGTPTELPLTKTITDPNDIAFRMAQLNPVVDLQLGDTIIVTEQGEPLWNTRVLSHGTYEMVGKATRQYFTFQPVMGSGCTQNGQDQSSSYCHECHAVEK